MAASGTSFERLRKDAGGAAINGLLSGLSRIGRMHPLSRPSRHDVEILPDVRYAGQDGREHLLDVYRPIRRDGLVPTLLYVHGGGFRILSKETHWMMALAFARQGYVVFTINYRLAPRHPFPAALEDASEAYRWVVENAERYGGDPARLVLSGESAGANLVCSLAIQTCWERPEPWARPVWECGVVPRALVPKCGMLQVSDAQRFVERRKLSTFLSDRIGEVSLGYLGDGRAGEPGGHTLADPVVFLEGAEPPRRPFPPTIVTVGTRDPILDDSRRLPAALARLGVRAQLEVYPGEIHAFQAFVYRRQARDAWTKTFAFLKSVPGAHPEGERAHSAEATERPDTSERVAPA